MIKTSPMADSSNYEIHDWNVREKNRLHYVMYMYKTQAYLYVTSKT